MSTVQVRIGDRATSILCSMLALSGCTDLDADECVKWYCSHVSDEICKISNGGLRATYFKGRDLHSYFTAASFPFLVTFVFLVGGSSLASFCASG